MIEIQKINQPLGSWVAHEWLILSTNLAAYYYVVECQGDSQKRNELRFFARKVVVVGHFEVNHVVELPATCFFCKRAL